jgi:integrase
MARPVRLLDLPCVRVRKHGSITIRRPVPKAIQSLIGTGPYKWKALPKGEEEGKRRYYEAMLEIDAEFADARGKLTHRWEWELLPGTPITDFSRHPTTYPGRFVSVLRNGEPLPPRPTEGMAVKVIANILPPPEPEPVIIRGRWLIWLMATTGTGPEEAGGAFKANIRQIDGIWVFDVTTEHRDRARLKTENRPRRIPLHAALIAEGFLLYVASLPDGSPLFPSLNPGRYNRRGDAASRKCNRFIRGTALITEKSKSAYCLRHTFNTLCRIARIRREFREVLMGHREERELLAREDNEINDNYGINPIRLLKDEIEKITFRVGG